MNQHGHTHSHSHTSDPTRPSVDKNSFISPQWKPMKARKVPRSPHLVQHANRWEPRRAGGLGWAGNPDYKEDFSRLSRSLKLNRVGWEVCASLFVCMCALVCVTEFEKEDKPCRHTLIGYNNYKKVLLCASSRDRSSDTSPSFIWCMNWFWLRFRSFRHLPLLALWGVCVRGG